MTSKFSAHPRSTAAAVALGLGATLILAGVASADPKVVAKVDGSPITDEDVAIAMADIGPGLPQKLEGAARQKYVLDYLIDLKLAAKKAEADNLDQAPDFAKKLAYYRGQAVDGGAPGLGRQGGERPRRPSTRPMTKPPRPSRRRKKSTPATSWCRPRTRRRRRSRESRPARTSPRSPTNSPRT